MANNWQPPSVGSTGWVPGGLGLGAFMGGLRKGVSKWSERRDKSAAQRLAIQQYEAEEEKKRLKKQWEDVFNVLRAQDMKNKIEEYNLEAPYMRKGIPIPWKAAPMSQYQEATLPQTLKKGELSIEETGVDIQRKKQLLEQDKGKPAQGTYDDVMKFYTSESTNIAKNAYNLSSGALSDYEQATHEILTAEHFNDIQDKYKYWHQLISKKGGGYNKQVLEKLTTLKILLEQHFKAGGQQITEPQYKESYELPGGQGMLSPQEFNKRLDEALGLTG